MDGLCSQRNRFGLQQQLGTGVLVQGGEGSASLSVLIICLRCSRDVLTLPHHGSIKAPKSCMGLKKTLKAKGRTSWRFRTELQWCCSVTATAIPWGNLITLFPSQGEGFKEPAVSDQPSEERHGIIGWFGLKGTFKCMPKLHLVHFTVYTHA